MRRSHRAHRPGRAPLFATATAAVAVLLLAACGDDDPQVAAARADGTVATTTTTAASTSTSLDGTATQGSAATAATVAAGDDATLPPVRPDATVAGDPTTSTTTTLVGPDLPTTTIPGRRLYTVTGTLGVFPVSGTICAMDVAGAAGTLVAPEGSVVDEPEVGTISYGGEISFAATSQSEGTFQFSINAYATNFTGNGTYSISWIDNRRSGYMELTEASGHASNPVVDEDDTSEQEMIFSVVASGTC